eukprot:UN4901
MVRRLQSIRRRHLRRSTMSSSGLSLRALPQARKRYLSSLAARPRMRFEACAWLCVAKVTVRTHQDALLFFQSGDDCPPPPFQASAELLHFRPAE